jgi:hypothetical protein
MKEIGYVGSDLARRGASIDRTASGHRRPGYDRRIIDFTMRVCWPSYNRIASCTAHPRSPSGQNRRYRIPTWESALTSNSGR